MQFDFLTFAAAAILLATVGMQVVATRRVRRDISFDPEQRRMQYWLIWLLPILGAGIVLSVLKDEPRMDKPRQERSDS